MLIRAEISPRSWRARGRRAAWALSTLLALAVLAAPATLGAAAPAPSAPADLRQAITGRYEVLPLREGLLLKPRKEQLGVRTIEIGASTVSINGERVSTGVLRAWLGDEADPVLRLAALPPAERRALFGLAGEVAGAPAPPSPAPPLAEPPAPPAEIAEGEDPAAAADEANAGDAADDDEAGTEEEAAVEPPALPGVPSTPKVSTGSRVGLPGSVTVAADEVADDVVAIGGPVRIRGKVMGDVVAIGGPVWIYGEVGGDIVAVGGSVHLEASSEVMGEVTSVWGSIHRAPGARVHGNLSEVSGLEPGIGERRSPHLPMWPLFGATHFFLEMVLLLLMALLLCVTYLVAPARVERAEGRIAVEPWKAGAVGFLALLFFFPLLAIATIFTCCLAVLLYPFIALAVFALILLGNAAISLRVGRWSEGRFGWRLGNPYRVLLTGFFLLQVLTLIGRVLGLGGGMLGFFSAMFLIGGFVVHIAAWLMGIGAVLLDLNDDRNLRRRQAYEVPTPPMSPIPPAPPPPAPVPTILPPPPPAGPEGEI